LILQDNRQKEENKVEKGKMKKKEGKKGGKEKMEKKKEVCTSAHAEMSRRKIGIFLAVGLYRRRRQLFQKYSTLLTDVLR